MSVSRASILRDRALRDARDDAETSLRHSGPTGLIAHLMGGERILGLVTDITGDIVTVIQDLGGVTKFKIDEIKTTGIYSRDPAA